MINLRTVDVVEMFGADNTGSDRERTTQAIREAFSFASRNQLPISFPGGVYSISPGTVFNIGNIPHIAAFGAKLEDARFLATGTSSFTWEGGYIKQVEDDTDIPVFDVRCKDTVFSNLKVEHEKAFGGICIRGGSNIQIENYTGYGTGSPPIVLWGHDITMNNLIFPQHDKDSYWDDCITLDAVGGDTYNISINNVTVNGFSDIVAIGTAINPEGNTNRPYGVYNVTASNCIGKNVEYGIFIKPGNKTTGYKNGYVEDVGFTNIRAYDKNGEKFKTLIRITPSNGSRVKDISFTDIYAKGRMVNGSQEPFLIMPYDAATVENIHFTNIGYNDYYNGEPNSSEKKGYPPIYGFHIKPLDSNSIVKDIVVDGLRIAGCSANWVYVESKVEGLEIRNPTIRNAGSKKKII